jgi:hypothetical protein
MGGQEKRAGCEIFLREVEIKIRREMFAFLLAFY